MARLTLLQHGRQVDGNVIRQDKKEIQENPDVDYENERKLIRRVKQGFQPAFSQLVALHQKRVFRMAYGFFQDRDDAMEIVQETFLRVYQKIDSFDEDEGKTRFNNWVYRIAYNLCIDYYRKFKKKKAEMKDLYLHDKEIRNDTTKPEDKMDRERFRSTLKKHVQHLPRKQKMVFVLRHYSGYKHHEIASMLNLSVGTIKSLYHRSIQSIKKNLGPENIQDQANIG